jgi:hypothetical protein
VFDLCTYKINAAAVEAAATSRLGIAPSTVGVEPVSITVVALVHPLALLLASPL